VRPSLPFSRGKNRKTLIDLRKAENDDMDALLIRSIKNSKSLLERPAMTVFVAAFDAKAFNGIELWKSCLASGNRIFKLHGRTNR